MNRFGHITKIKWVSTTQCFILKNSLTSPTFRPALLILVFGLPNLTLVAAFDFQGFDQTGMFGQGNKDIRKAGLMSGLGQRMRTSTPWIRFVFLVFVTVTKKKVF